MRRVFVISTPQEAQECDMHGAVAVVIDVFRATSVMATALHNGAIAIVPVLTPDEALAYKKSSAGNILLGGERAMRLIDGFDLDNSPLSYTSSQVKNKTIVMTTTNGTRAIKACHSAHRLFVASFLNASQTIKCLDNLSTDIYLVCSGTNGLFTMEDGLCAGLLASELSATSQLDDMALVMKAMYQQYKDNLAEFLSQGEHYRRLVSNGFATDIDWCLDMNKDYGLVECVDGQLVQTTYNLSSTQ